MKDDQGILTYTDIDSVVTGRAAAYRVAWLLGSLGIGFIPLILVAKLVEHEDWPDWLSVVMFIPFALFVFVCMWAAWRFKIRPHERIIRKELWKKLAAFPELIDHESGRMAYRQAFLKKLYESDDEE